MPKIQIITDASTERHGQALADGIQQKMGVGVGVSTVPPTPPILEKFGRLLDTLAVLRETEHTLKTQALRLIADHPELIRDDKNLTLDDRIANTVSNRQIIRETYGDSRPVHPPELMIRAGAQVAQGGEAQHLGSLVYLSAQHASISEESFQAGLKAPWRSTIELGRRIQARIDHPTVRNLPERSVEDEYEPGED